MSGPITPHIEVAPVADGVRLKLKHVELVLPPQMARDIAALLVEAAANHDPLGVSLMPRVTPQGDPL